MQTYVYLSISWDPWFRALPLLSRPLEVAAVKAAAEKRAAAVAQGEGALWGPSKGNARKRIPKTAWGTLGSLGQPWGTLRSTAES